MTLRGALLPVCLLLMTTVAGHAAESPEIADRVRHWLMLVDKGDYGDSWFEAGVLFKTRITERDWMAKVAPVRGPLGALVSRTPASQQLARTLPGLPDGDYDIIRFNSVFEHKKQAVETVVLQQEPEGWKVDGYFIK